MENLSASVISQNPVRKKAPRPFAERLLRIMDKKDHPAYWALMGPQGKKEQLRIHYLQEWGVYVRDFPLFLARLLAKNPPADVRRDLAENLYEEETGKLTLGVPHPELFLRMMEGLGFERADFEKVELPPAAAAYRDWIDKTTTKKDWLTGVAVATIFIEGSRKDREEIEGSKKEETAIEEKLAKHPLVLHQGLDPQFLDLQRAHARAESGHRVAAWRMVLDHAVTEDAQKQVEAALKKSLKLWKSYRDGVAQACGIAAD